MYLQWPLITEYDKYTGITLHCIKIRPTGEKSAVNDSQSLVQNKRRQKSQLVWTESGKSMPSYSNLKITVTLALKNDKYSQLPHQRDPRNQRVNL